MLRQRTPGFTRISPGFTWTSLWLGFAALLLWPALVNGGPFWFPDTSSYVRAADAAVVVLTDSPSEWSDRITIPGAGGTAQAASAAPVAGGGPAAESDKVVEPHRPVLNNRSIYYGMFLYLPLRLAGPWGAVIIQALAVAGACLFCMAVAMRRNPSRRTAWIAGSIGILALLTPLSYYTCMFMPDVWSGVLIALLGVAACFRERLSRREFAAVLICCAMIATFHATHILLAASMAIAALLVLPTLAGRMRGATLALGAAAAGIAGSMLFSGMVERYLGQEPLSPPFLSARLSDSGPGVAYLATHCDADAAPDAGASSFALCAYRHRLPLASDNFLWSAEERNGLFQVVPADVQRRISQEDKRFFLSVVLADPAAYAVSFAETTVETLASYDLLNFNYTPLRLRSLDNYPPAIREGAVASLAARNRMPTDFVTVATVVVVVASSLALLLIFARMVSGRAAKTDIARFAAIVALGVLANAAICGAFSKPDARYHMRLVWLLPLAACLLVRESSPSGADNPLGAGRLSTTT